MTSKVDNVAAWNGWFGRYGTRAPSSNACSATEVRAYMAAMTKAQLADLAAEAIALLNGHGDEPISLAEVNDVLIGGGE